MGIIVFVGLIALIAWGLNYIVTKDYVIVRTPIVDEQNNINENAPASSLVATTTTTSSTTTSDTSSTNAATIASTTSANSSNLTVTFNGKSFSPTSLTIKKGQTVKFVNNGSEKMWVASNPFPSSADYPAFNEKSGADVGSSWSFTFDKTGVWFYHNHYHPAQGAKIVVNAK